MESITDDKLPHTVVYWAPKPATKSGQPDYEEPVELNARWLLKETQVITPDGSVITSQTQVWTECLTAKNGFLLKGGLEDVTNSRLPMQNTNAYRIKIVAEHPTVDGTDQVYVAFL